MRIYISGKITGLPEAKYKQYFKAAEEEIRAIFQKPGHELYPVNPITLNHSHDGTWHDYMAVGLSALLKCDAVYLLKNWGQSKGARCEYAIARELGLSVYFQE